MMDKVEIVPKIEIYKNVSEFVGLVTVLDGCQLLD